MPLPYRLPWTETLREVPPGDPGPIPIDDPLHHLTIITPRPGTTDRLRHQRLDPSPRHLTEFS
jgi:hypothetical protein